MNTYKVFIVSDSEIRIIETSVDGTDTQLSLRQKKVTYEPGPLDTVFTYDELLEAASIIVHCRYLRERYEQELDLIAWCLSSQKMDPPRHVIVTAIKILLTRWITDCMLTETCNPAPSIDMLNDAALRKILIAYHNLKKKQTP